MSALAAGSASTLPTSRAPSSLATGLGPRAALKKSGLQAMPQAERKQWIEEARIDAILGSSSASLKSMRSGICCFITFAGGALSAKGVDRACLFVTPSDSCQQGRKGYFLAWSTLFRCRDTFSNYLNYARTACLLVKASIEVGLCLAVFTRNRCQCMRMRSQVFQHPALKKAKCSIEKSGRFNKRERLWVQRCEACC